MAQRLETSDAKEARGVGGRFANAIDDRSLLTIVRAILEFVAAHADPPILPTEVSQARFDEARAAAGYPNVKRGWAICRQLKVTWNRVKEIALAPSDAEVTQGLAAGGRPTSNRLTREEAITSIQIVARHLGATSLRGETYEAGRLEILERERLHWRSHSQIPYSLLTLGQIEVIAPFQGLARKAGLEAPPPQGGRAGVAHLEAIAGFYDELGYLPASIEMLRQYANAKGYAVATKGPDGNKSIGPSNAAFLAQWRANNPGREWPGEVPKHERRVPSDVPRSDDPTLPVTRRKSWSYETCIEALVQLLGETGGKPLSQKRYRRLAKGRPELPDASTVSYWAKKHNTTFTRMRDEAVQIKHGPRAYPGQMDELPPELDADAVAKKFAPQFEAATNLQRYAWTHRPKERATGGKLYRSLIFAIFARATLTYRAVLHLCRGGYTEQADMLIRSLFEDMAIALWVSLPEHQEESLELLQKHNDFGRLLAADSLEKHEDWLGPVPFDVDDLGQLEKNRGEYEKLFGRYGEKSWTTKSLHSILTEIEHLGLWEDEERRKRELWGYYALGHRVNNLKLHSSALSLNQAAKHSGFEEGTAVIRLSASPTDDEQPMLRALYGAMFTYGRITRLVIEETGGDANEFDVFYDKQLGIAHKLAPSKRGKIARNDQCPCGSGKKYKVCHGARAAITAPRSVGALRS